MLRRILMVASIAALLGACEGQETATAEPQEEQGDHAEARKLATPKTEGQLAQAQLPGGAGLQDDVALRDDDMDDGLRDDDLLRDDDDLLGDDDLRDDDVGSDRLSSVGEPAPLPEVPAPLDEAPRPSTMPEGTPGAETGLDDQDRYAERFEGADEIGGGEPDTYGTGFEDDDTFGDTDAFD